VAEGGRMLYILIILIIAAVAFYLYRRRMNA
jgi:LPXTG-motif cell wall-anchored protein